MDVGAERLFHALVVVGTSLTGACGGNTSELGTPDPSDTDASPLRPDDAGHGDRDGNDGARPEPAMCASFSQFRCVDYQRRTGCICDPMAPRGPENCLAPGHFACEAYLDPKGGLGIQIGPGNVGCRCDPSRVGTPDDCEYAEQLMCDHYEPRLDNCVCNPSAPRDPADCTNEGYFCCRRASPRYGCSCNCVVIR